MKSIRRHLSAGLLGAFAVLLGGGGVLVYFSTRAALLAQVDARLRVEALSVLKQTRQEKDGGEHEGDDGDHRNYDQPGNRELEVSFTDKYMPEFDTGGSEFFQVWAPNGKTVKRSDSLAKTDLPCRGGTTDRPFFWSLALPSGMEARAIGITFVPPTPGKQRKWHDPNFTSTVVVASGLGELKSTLATLRNVLCGVGALGLLSTLALVPLLLRRGLAPLQLVASHAATLEAATLQARFSTTNLPDELRPICLRLNELLTRLEQAFERERRFSADVAHELRTPIAELRALAEVALKWPDGAETKAAAFQDALAISRQMESIVTSLLGITRCEAGRQTIQRATIDVAKVVQECWRPFAATAEQKQLRVHFAITPEATLDSDRAMLSLILANLFSNATEYAPHAGTVTVGFLIKDSATTLSVTNTVEVLEPEDVPKLFDRFWRKDAARSSSAHSGLGLPLSKACAETLGMKLTAEMTGARELTVALIQTCPGSCHPQI